jgi:hypothetical protein
MAAWLLVITGSLECPSLSKGFDGHEAQPVAGGLVAVDDPTECKLAYFAVVSHPAAETVAHLIDKFLQRRFAQRLWFAWLRSRLHFGYVVAKLPGSVPPHPFRGDRLRVRRVTNVAHVRNGTRQRSREIDARSAEPDARRRGKDRDRKNRQPTRRAGAG